MERIKNQSISAKSFVMIMIVVALLALALRFGFKQLLEFNISQNESSAQNTLKIISVALENYAKASNGAYPETFANLTKTSPRYLDADYLTKSPIKGYTYSCSRLDALGYSCVCVPLSCGFFGRTNYSIATGGLFISEKCGKNEPRPS